MIQEAYSTRRITYPLKINTSLFINIKRSNKYKLLFKFDLDFLFKYFFYVFNMYLFISKSC